MTDVLKQQSTIKVSTLSRNLKELKQVLINLTKSPMMDKNSLLYSGELDKRYEKAVAAFNKVSYEIYRADGELRTEARMGTMGGGAGKTFSLDKTKGKYAGIIKNFQEAYMELRQYMLQVQSMIEGKLGEYGIAGILAALECTTLKDLKDVLGQLQLGKTSKNNSIAVTGDVSSRKVLLQSNLYIGTGGTEKDAKNFINELNKAQSKSEAKFARYATEVDKDGNIVAATKTQDKVDLTFTFRDDDENYNLSIKNYNFDSFNTITLHTGNLLRLIQDYHVFINHLLNIFPERSPQEGNNANLSGYATVAERILKELIAYKGLTGGVNAMMSDGSIQKTAEVN